MQITPSAIEAIQKGFDLRYQQAFNASKPHYPMLATEIPSSAKEDVHGFLDKIPRMREWVGERVVQNLAAREFSIKNKHFELTLEVDRDDIEDDRLGVYNPMLDMMGGQASMYPDDLLIALIQGGTTGLCYDGQYFFDTDHPVNIDDPSAGTQANLFASKALSAANYGAVRAGMAAFKGADGRPLGVRPTHLVVPPLLEETARQILNADFIPNAGGTATQSNVWKGSAELIVWDQLAGEDDAWYLLDLSKAIRPFVFQNRKAPQFAYLTDPTSENVFKRKKFLFGVDARGNAGYALWFLAARAKA